MSQILRWSGYKWLKRERWGEIHPKKAWNWYDPSCTTVGENGELELHINYNPREFYLNDKKVISKYGTGIVTCETDFSYGRFEIEAKLPKGPGMWPAFWLYGANTWPPEIDIVEGYSKTSNYFNWFLLKPYRVESCLHSHKDRNLKKIPTRKPWFWQLCRNPAESFNVYTLDWKKDGLYFYINGKKVRTIQDKEIIEYINEYPKMRVLINNHIDGNHLNDFSVEETNTPFRVSYFKYTKLQ